MTDFIHIAPLRFFEQYLYRNMIVYEPMLKGHTILITVVNFRTAHIFHNTMTDFAS